MTSSIIVFSLIYVCSDIFSEDYDYTWPRMVSWIAFAINILMAVIFEIIIVLPGNDAVVSDAFKTILGSSFGILAALQFAYMCGDLFNDIIFEHIKHKDIKNDWEIYSVFSYIKLLLGDY